MKIQLVPRKKFRAVLKPLTLYSTPTKTRPSYSYPDGAVHTDILLIYTPQNMVYEIDWHMKRGYRITHTDGLEITLFTFNHEVILRPIYTQKEIKKHEGNH